MTLGPKGYLRLSDTFRVVSSVSGVNLKPTVLDTNDMYFGH